MSYENPGAGALDYLHCRYGKSKLLFRGPRRRLTGNYAAFFGSTETYGKFLERPFPALVEQATGQTCVNFGCVNAGVDVFANDGTLLDAARHADVTVVQIMGAQNMSNRFYSVHPRRNDRFLRASILMKTVYADVDFTQFNFTRHMLATLQRANQEKFLMLVNELKAAWTARMNLLLDKIEGQVVLLWVRSPDKSHDGLTNSLGPDPLFVDEAMVAGLIPKISAVVEVAPSSEAMMTGTEGMVFSELDAPAAAEMYGPRVHQEIADALVPTLEELFEG